jgi:hypothetical protein
MGINELVRNNNNPSGRKNKREKGEVAVASFKNKPK